MIGLRLSHLITTQSIGNHQEMLDGPYGPRELRWEMIRSTCIAWTAWHNSVWLLGLCPRAPGQPSMRLAQCWHALLVWAAPLSANTICGPLWRARRSCYPVSIFFFTHNFFIWIPFELFLDSLGSVHRLRPHSKLIVDQISRHFF